MAECQLVVLWKAGVGRNVSDVRMSADGQYLLAKGDGQVAYYNWGPQLLWQGRVQGTLRHVAVSSKRDRVLLASDGVVCSLKCDGQRLWDGLTRWTVQALHLNATQHCIVGSDGSSVGCLDQKGEPIWQHDLRKAVRSVTISPDGQWILAGGEDSKVTCLNCQGQVIWVSQLDQQVTAIGAGRGIVGVGDASNVVHCLDGNGHELCRYEIRGQLKNVAVNTAGKYIAVGTESELYQFFLTDATMLFMPVRPMQTGAQGALEQLGADNIQNVSMNHDGLCLLVEGRDDQRCYDLEGRLLWSYPKAALKTILDEYRHKEGQEKAERQLPRKEDLTAKQSAQQAAEVAARLARQQAAELARLAVQRSVKQIQEAFTAYVVSQSGGKAREAQARQNVRLEGEVLDLYFDGKGYLFVPVADLDTVRRAAKLARHTNIYIVTHSAPDDVIQLVKRTRGVNLCRLSDMTKTTGLFEGSDFETFMMLQGKMLTKA